MTMPEPVRAGANLQAVVARLASQPRQPAPPEPEPWEVPELRTESDARLRGRWLQTIPSRFADAKLSDFTDWPAKLADDLAEWAAAPRGRNLVLWGSVGCGKTHAGVAACRPAVFDHHLDVKFAPVVELLDELREQGGDAGREAMHAAMDVDLLLLDDSGGERPTDWTAERLYAIVNRRWLEQRPVVATTNLPLTAKVVPEGYSGPTLEEALGVRTFSRLVGSGAVVRRLVGPDRRR